MATKIKKFYAVKNGRKTGVFFSWDECKRQVMGYSGAVYKSFITQKEAFDYMRNNENSIKDKRNIANPEYNENMDRNDSGCCELLKKCPENEAVAYVDGSYRNDTKEYSFGAVILTANGEFEFGEKAISREFADMRNVAGEIEGAEFAMKYALENNIKKLKIHYDYMGIECWCTRDWQAGKDRTIQYRDFYDEVSQYVEVEFVKVKAHSGNKYNDRADMLAKNALGLS